VHPRAIRHGTHAAARAKKPPIAVATSQAVRNCALDRIEHERIDDRRYGTNLSPNCACNRPRLDELQLDARVVIVRASAARVHRRVDITAARRRGKSQSRDSPCRSRCHSGRRLDDRRADLSRSATALTLSTTGSATFVVVVINAFDEWKRPRELRRPADTLSNDWQLLRPPPVLGRVADRRVLIVTPSSCAPAGMVKNAASPLIHIRLRLIQP
jgi:hypothetical protein